MDATYVGISVAAGLLGALTTLGFIFGRPRLYPAGPYVQSVTEYITIINWFRVLYYFLPYGLFLFGIIYDGLIRKIKFFPAGFTGLGAILINHLISGMLGGATGVSGATDSDICGVPGMSSWGSHIAPQNITFASTVLSYIASYITASQSDSQYSGIAWSGVFAVWVVQAVMFNVNKCDSSKASGWMFTFGNSFASKIIPPLIGLASGLLWGGLAGWGVSRLGGDAGISPSQQQTLVGDKGPAMAPTSGVTGAGKCSSTDSDDQFVCEAYKNGELVTSTIVE